jgi:L-threonylcarbamoyladenylate synthase
MKILKITKQSIKEAVSILNHGGIVAYPTETAYALGCDATSKKAVAKIFKIKNRPKEKNLPAICASRKQVEKFFEMPDAAWELWKKYWPKPVSVILKLRMTNDELRIKRQEIPVRISSNKTARALARKLGRPIIATSANISGRAPIYDPKDLIKEFEGKKYQPELILDGGKLPPRPPSTIIKFQDVESPTLNIEVIRQGEVKI